MIGSTRNTTTLPRTGAGHILKEIAKFGEIWHFIPASLNGKAQLLWKWQWLLTQYVWGSYHYYKGFHLHSHNTFLSCMHQSHLLSPALPLFPALIPSSFCSSPSSHNHPFKYIYSVGSFSSRMSLVMHYSKLHCNWQVTSDFTAVENIQENKFGTSGACRLNYLQSLLNRLKNRSVFFHFYSFLSHLTSHVRILIL